MKSNLFDRNINYRWLWSCRINDEHRLIYKVCDDAIAIVSCSYHYK
ncbi:MAG: type II toxin-antitoxin system YoeB family toxin [Epsilonproteobacteria bacterium]|nr:type II toxin-antitoxin system YoeB family toxin [Campylobacterota bacterium]